MKGRRVNASPRQFDARGAASSRTPLPAALRFLGVPLSLGYGCAVGIRNAWRDRRPGRRVGRPVVSVGNLSAGGTGKTPVVAWLAEELLRRGHRPAIAMRGYKASRGGKSDEQLEHESRLPGVPVVARPDRFVALRRFLPTRHEIDIVLLDDGFQHRQLHRDFDLVLVDSLRSPFNDALLPRGYLREPVENLRRADAIALTRTDLAGEEDLADLRSHLRRLTGAEPLAEFAASWSRVDSTNAAEPRDASWLRGRRFVALCGIGRPEAFLAMIGRAGAHLADTILLPDHARYDARLLREAAERAGGTEGLLTTAKDWVKIEPLMQQHRLQVAMHRPRFEMRPVRGGDALLGRVLGLLAAAEDRDGR